MIRFQCRDCIFAYMKNRLDIFVELGRRLAGFGSDELTKRCMEEAHDQNNWFSESDVRRAVGAIASQMLVREKLETWVQPYPLPVAEQRNVLVVMAGNIPLVGFFDMLCVLMAGHRAWVKCSAKDRVLMEYVVGLLREIEPEVPIFWSDGGDLRPDAVIATGSDNTNRYFRTRYAGIPSLLRGSRQSVAVLDGGESQEQLQGLADDVFAYSGLGCRNVSLIFVPRGTVLKLPVRQMNDKYCHNYLQTRAVLTMQGIPFEDLGTAVLVEERAFPNALSRINYSYYDSLQEVEDWLRMYDDELQCVVSQCVGHSRRVGFGVAQAPRLTDWPDDRDVLEFLATLP